MFLETIRRERANMNKLNRPKIVDWRESDIGCRGFFQGYATAEEDAIERALHRVGHVVANIRAMILAGRSEAELLALLDRIKGKND